MAATGPMGVPDHVSEGELSCLFINNKITLFSQVEERGNKCKHKEVHHF